ncbi:MAG: cell division protein ZipA [Proteobacteria bacterium]|nr:cell division protein ZipA [Pseudomonadota bacterium]
MIPHLNILIAIVAGLIVLVTALIFYSKQKSQKSSYIRDMKEPSFENLPDLTDDYESEIISIRTISQAELQAKTQNRKTSKKTAPRNDQILTMHLYASPGEEFQGYELLQALLSNGMRFGEMNIFHRYQDINGHGPVLFSMASAVEPGTFDIENMGAFSCPALTFFMRLTGDLNEMRVFELLLDTVRQLKDELNGVIYDGNRSPLTPQSITNYKLQVSRMRSESSFAEA